MYKHKKRILAAALCALMLAGCQFVGYDKEKDMAQVVAQIGTVKITKQQVYDTMTPYLDYYASTYSLDSESEDYKKLEKDLKTQTLKTLVEVEVVMQKAEADGTAKLTQDEQNQIDQDYQSALDYYTTQARSDLEEEKKTDASVDVEASLDAKVDSLLKDDGLTRESLKQEYNKNFIYTKYKDKIIANVTATDEQTQKYYDKEAAEQKETYDKTPSQVDTDFENNKVILYYPTRHVLVTHVLISISDADKKAIDAVNNNTALSDDEKTKQADALTEKALKKIKPTADLVYGKAKAGDDFSKLIEQYGGDSGMKDDTIMSRGGYLLSEDNTDYEEAFKNAALALKKAGDISEPTATGYGYHIICAQAVYEAGTQVPLDSVRDNFKSQADSLAQDDAWNAHVDELKKEFKVTTRENLL